MEDIKVNENVAEKEKFDTVIEPVKKGINLKVGEVWKYRDLIKFTVKRNFVAGYKQTILGPLWAIIQPIMTTLIFTIVFGNIAGLSPSGIPTFVFYLCGTVVWQFFANNLNGTSGTFTANSGVFGKVYFPRLTMPISTVFTNLISFGIQFAMFLIFWVIYLCTTNTIHPNLWMLATPAILLQLMLLGLGFGIIVSSLTTKYRDLVQLIGFGVSLWMYMTPVAYSIDAVGMGEKAIAIYMLNPITPLIEIFRYGWLGVGRVELLYWGISWVVTILVLLIGIALFNKVEKTFMDTV